MNVTPEHRRWFKQLKKVLNQTPEGMEVVITGDNHIAVYEEGALVERHLGSSLNGWGIMEDSLFECSATRLYPYGEGS